MTSKTSARNRATRWIRSSFLSILICTAVAAIPSAAHALSSTGGQVFQQNYCVLGWAQFDTASGLATAIVYTDGYCNYPNLHGMSPDPRTMTPFTSSQISVHPIVWYYDSGSGSWLQCQVGSEKKLSNAYTTSASVYATSCPHGHYISVWAHVSAQPVWTLTWYGGDVYGDAVWYP